MITTEILENAVHNFKTFRKMDPWPAKNPFFVLALEQLENAVKTLTEKEEKEEEDIHQSKLLEALKRLVCEVKKVPGLDSAGAIRLVEAGKLAEEAIAKATEAEGK